MNDSNLWLAFTILEVLSALVTWKFFVAAGRKPWEAFIPIYNTYVLTRIIERPWWWTILMYVPVVGNVMGIVIVFELLHVFNYRKLSHTIYTILTAGLYLGYLNYTGDLKFVGRDIKNMRKHVSELGASLIFAIVAATIIRTFTFEAYTIPTPSMEKSLMVGDFLFVSKMHYGSRMPMTPLSIPLVHNRVPLLPNVKSYSELIRLPYFRFPKFESINRMDAVVFNYPAEDERPVDKRENYVKRCLAIPGDSLKIVDRQVYINGEKQELPERANPQWSYYVSTQGLDFNAKQLKKDFDINYVKGPELRKSGGQSDVYLVNQGQNVNEYLFNSISQDKLDEFKKLPQVTRVIPIESRTDGQYPKDTPQWLLRYYRSNTGPSNDIFPNPVHGKLAYRWTRDNYGPVYIPKKGDVISFNEDSYYRYQRIIRVYEGNDLVVDGETFLLNGEPASEYTFKQNYYWMMGDNRHNSLDSRYWGYVPEDHIVGKPVFIWMSYDKYQPLSKAIRTERVFTVVHGDGPRQSYFFHFLIAVALFYTGSYFYKRRKKEKAA